jgi:hypothetical protein
MAYNGTYFKKTKCWLQSLLSYGAVAYTVTLVAKSVIGGGVVHDGPLPIFQIILFGR